MTKYSVMDDGKLISMAAVPEDWAVVEITKAIDQMDWQDEEIWPDVFDMCEIISLDDIPITVRDKRAEMALEQVELAA